MGYTPGCLKVYPGVYRLLYTAKNFAEISDRPLEKKYYAGGFCITTYGRFQKLLIKRVAVNRVCARGYAPAKNTVFLYIM